MTANDTAAASYQLRRKDVELMRQALEALEYCHDLHCALPAENGVPESIGDKQRASAAIAALNERLLRE